MKEARTEALGAEVAKVRRGSGLPASLDDKAEPDREVTDRRPALLEVMAMTTSSFQAAVVIEKGQGKEQDERTTKERVSLEFGKLFCRQEC